MSTVHERLAKHILADGYPIVMDMDKSHGSYVVDDKGNEYLDMFSMFASTAIGYNHPHLMEKIEFLGRNAVNKPAMSDIYTKDYADLIDTFERVAMPKELQYLFFISGGTLAVENALKTAFDWKTRLNLSKGIQQEAGEVIHFKQAFHGRSGYTLSLTNTKDPRKYEYFPKFDWPRIDNPKIHYPVTEDNLSKTIDDEKRAIEQIENVLATRKNKVACIIIEPIQGEGGDNYFRKEFFKKLREICDKEEILLIFDEVQTGIGMTGKMWAFQHFDVVPDVVSFGKKTQVCGILANKEKLDQIPNNVFKESSRINSTFGGNYIDMLRFKLILEVIEKENLVHNAEEKGKYIIDRLNDIAKHTSKIHSVRGLGLFIAFDFDSDINRSAFINKCFDNKMIILPCGEKSVRLRPHLNLSFKEVNQALEIIKLALK
ncbi:L-lysine 6-transaminase [Algoriella xinjiangensis]|uniref:L-lysine-epsilon aminotransferase n=1 Tax=Algoriella xinjiangensis TaxID=684065 RepID=A0A1I5AJK4_9FLAO|nr:MULTISPECIES: L-lysine 6-transaminase [Algoriella]MBO6211950.1 L-lysine 6-transaminase [Algoriella sp.]SFN62617.1 L-lysine 6-transaminase [Algoriella xinjiangensis]VDH16268.1 Probable L-lysine-epsilon aminotransferase [Algoriella xinjiangensis]